MFGIYSKPSELAAHYNRGHAEGVFSMRKTVEAVEQKLAEEEHRNSLLTQERDELCDIIDAVTAERDHARNMVDRTTQKICELANLLPSQPAIYVDIEVVDPEMYTTATELALNESCVADPETDLQKLMQDALQALRDNTGIDNTSVGMDPGAKEGDKGEMWMINWGSTMEEDLHEAENRCKVHKACIDRQAGIIAEQATKISQLTVDLDDERAKNAAGHETWCKQVTEIENLKGVVACHEATQREAEHLRTCLEAERNDLLDHLQEANAELELFEIYPRRVEAMKRIRELQAQVQGYQGAVTDCRDSAHDLFEENKKLQERCNAMDVQITSYDDENRKLKESNIHLSKSLAGTRATDGSEPCYMLFGMELDEVRVRLDMVESLTGLATVSGMESIQCWRLRQELNIDEGAYNHG